MALVVNNSVWVRRGNEVGTPCAAAILHAAVPYVVLMHGPGCAKSMRLRHFDSNAVHLAQEVGAASHARPAAELPALECRREKLRWECPQIDSDMPMIVKRCVRIPRDCGSMTGDHSSTQFRPVLRLHLTLYTRSARFTAEVGVVSLQCRGQNQIHAKVSSQTPLTLSPVKLSASAC